MDDYVSVIIGILFIVALFALSYFMKKKYSKTSMFKRNSKYINSLDRFIISNEQWLEIVKVGDEILLLGVSKENINLIKVLNSEKLKANDIEQEAISFKSVFNKYANRIKGNSGREKDNDKN